MKAYWMGQAAFLFRTQAGMTIMIDPYFSDSVEKAEGPGTKRQVPVNPDFIFTPDVLMFTHCHMDHMDFESVDMLISDEKKINIFAPKSCLGPLRERYAGKANFYIFAPGTEVTMQDAVLKALPAAHSDFDAIGIAIESGGKTVYDTGDTLYNKAVLEAVDFPVDLLILPINGAGNNMNPADAARFTRKVNPKAVFPMHWDMFPAYSIDPSLFTNLFTEEDSCRVLSSPEYAEFEI